MRVPKELRNEAVLALTAMKWSVDKISRILDLHPRTISRIRAGVRDSDDAIEAPSDIEFREIENRGPSKCQVCKQVRKDGICGCNEIAEEITEEIIPVRPSPAAMKRLAAAKPDALKKRRV